jgi:protocatechuate 3,4-dioxygenase beta subunit
MSEKTRRGFLVIGAAAIGGAALPELAQGQTLAPTPECKDGDEPTLRQTEGPFFRPQSPERSDLRDPDLKGALIEISGLVVSRSCKPVAGALVDLWHADANGDYDEKAYRCRGHQFTDANGRYLFRTIVPALYPGRTRHFHVKVQAPRRPVLTTQLYFPNEPGNRRDGLFRPELTMRMADAASGRFNFVLDLA